MITDSEIARLLNLNSNDSNNLTKLVNDFFANNWEDDTECPETGLTKEDALEDDEFDQCLDHFDSVMENDAMKEYKVFTMDCEFDQLEWEKASKFRLSQYHLTCLLSHYKENGIEPKEKKSGGRKSNTRSFEFEDIPRAVRFLTNYASENVLVLPGRVPGFKRDDIQLLSSSHTKVSVYNCYRQGLENTGHRIMGDSNILKLWKKVCPFIITAKPMTDLCWVCQENNSLIFRSDLTD
ncbi:hypothetical protein IRJ41_025886 [Triplophysa rosa]|uniref:Uncharacterized protein n=1 Tax=Triplophysa rosa TaxID=992332 RepID=A0A9W7WPQ4_TRIRA|nr:hypothetical protein IRJ41_025886 [Triplophysa rosa]